MRFQRMSIGGREMPAVLRPFGCVIAVACSILCAAPQPAWASPATTATALAVTSAGNAVTTVTSGSVVTLTATVTAGSTPVAPGQINFCDAMAKYCTDIHLLGTAQLTSAGTATLKLRPGIGSHSYKAVFVGTTANAASASTASALTVTGLYPTISTIAASGNPGDYTLTATVFGNGSASPTGTVSFLDTSNANQSLATAPLTPAAAGLSLLVAGANLLFLPANFVVGDFNGDGIPDEAAPNLNAGSGIEVWLGNGDGTFKGGIESTKTTSLLFAFVTVGDFNGDGKADLAVANYPDSGNGPYSVTILLGNGDGTFTQEADNPATGNQPLSIVAGDFNGDGNLDLAVANSGSNTLSILLGNGDGTFTAAASPATGSSPSSVVTGDFNGDGKLDLAVTNASSNTVSILLGNGDGTFTAAASPATDNKPVSVAVGDFNGDGNPDLAVANEGGNDLTILLGKGDGTFTAASSPVIAGPDSVAVGDFNGDGIVDLAVAGSHAAVLLGNGDGTFTASVTLPRVDNFDIQYQWMVPADFNGDGRTDIAGLLNGGIDGGNEDDSFIAVLLSETQSATATANNISVSPAGLNLPTHLVEASYPGDTAYNGSISNTTGLVGLAPFTLSGATNTPINVLQGTSSNTAVTVTPVAGFTGNVALTCSIAAAPAVATPATCSITPSVTLSGTAAATATLTILTQAQTSPTGYTVTVTGSAEGASETITYQQVLVLYGVFTMTSTPVTVEAGSTGNSTITITPSASFTGTVALQCAFQFLGSANSPCSIPPSVAISGTTTPVTVSLAISPGVGFDPGNFVVTVMGTASNGTSTGAPVSVTVPVTVTQGPNFTLSSTAVTIAPGGTGISTLTVTPTLGFTGSVTLSCVPDYVPDQPNCTSPAPVTISGTAPVNVSIPVTIDAAAAPGTYGVEVATESYPGHVKSTEIAVTVAGPAIVPTYTLTNTAVNIASPGATGTSTITITPSGGFTGNVTLACTVAGPAAAIDPPTCAVPAQAAVTGTGAVTAMLTVYTTGAAASAPSGYVAKVQKPLKQIFALGGSVAMSALLLFGIPARRCRWKTLLSMLLSASIAGAVIGCGGATNAAKTPANPGTTLGAYTVTVTGTSGATVQSTAVTVGVN
jgi:DNA/RNA endonuclease YhcR with UshA esterase domain